MSVGQDSNPAKPPQPAGSESCPTNKSYWRNFMARLRFLPFCFVFLIFGFPSQAQESAKQALEFHISFDPSVSKSPFSGRVFVMLNKQANKDLPVKPKWFNPDPI